MPILQRTDNTLPGFIRDAAALGSRLGLERVERLCALLGKPQDRVPMLHVAGTNGKGSVCAMAAEALREAGYRTGLYTSPYIESIGECLSVNGEPISGAELAAMAEEMKLSAFALADAGCAPTQFELETALAFLWFWRKECDVAVIETGLGGRLDATNVINRPLASVITSISLDHTRILGDTIEQIAREKCGIVKPASRVVAYPAQRETAWRVIRESAAASGSPLAVPDMAALLGFRSGPGGSDIEYKGLRLHIPMPGSHQILNAVTAVEALLALRGCGMAISDGAIAAGIGRARVPMRQELIDGSPAILLDGAHNPDGLQALADTMKRNFSGRRIAVVMGMLADKDCTASIGLIAPLCGRFIACRPQNARALSPEQTAAIARKHCDDVAVMDDFSAALDGAVRYAGAGGAVVVCGSLYLAGPVRKLLIL